MQAPELVQKLRDYMDNPPYKPAKRHIAKPLADYIEQEICNGDKDSSAWRKVEEYLDVIAYRVIGPMQGVRNAVSTPEEWEGFYEYLHDEMLIQDLQFVIEDVISEEAAATVDRLLKADFYALMATFDRFMQKVYIDGGLRDRIAAKPHKSVVKNFGQMEFCCGISMGRLTIAFTPRGDNDGGNVTFRGEEDDMLGIRIGVAACYTTYANARTRVEEVMANWPMPVNNPA